MEKIKKKKCIPPGNEYAQNHDFGQNVKKLKEANIFGWKDVNVRIPTKQKKIN